MDNQFLNKYEQKSEFTPPKRGPRKAKKTNHTKLFVGIGVGAAVLLVILGMILFFNMNSQVTVVNMQGWKEDDVNLWATENKVMLRYTEAYSDEMAVGLMIEHTPGEGEVVEKGTFLEVVKSLGADPSVKVRIPDFMNMTQAEIQEWETDNHMSKVRITSENSKSVEVGNVITYTVNDTTVVGQEVRRDSPIYIIISNGTGEDGKVTLPDFTAMTLEMAETFAVDNEIVLEIEEVFDEMIPKEQIISQDIEMEEIIKVGEAVTLKVSKGPEIIMPDFSGYESDMAGTVASQNNIMYVIKETYSTSSSGRLVSQSISAGTLYDTEDILTLTYSLGNTVLIPSFVGQGEDALKAWITEYNALGTNIKISTTYTTSNDLPGTIITQDKADVSSEISATINLVVSKGKVVYVPDFVAQSGVGYDQAITREIAIAMCEEAGLVAVFEKQSKSGRLEGEVWSQSIAAGKEVQQGTKITLKYTAVTSTVKVPDFIGMTVDEVIAAGYHKQFYLEYDLSSAPNGSASPIESQSLSKETTVAPGSKIILNFGQTITEDEGIEEVMNES